MAKKGKRYDGATGRSTKKKPVLAHGTLHPDSDELVWCATHKSWEPRADLPVDRGSIRPR